MSVHFLLEDEGEPVPGQLARPPGGIMSNKYCLWSCSAACRWSSNIWEAAEPEPLLFEFELEEPEEAPEPDVPPAPMSWAMARAW